MKSYSRSEMLRVFCIVLVTVVGPCPANCERASQMAAKIISISHDHTLVVRTGENGDLSVKLFGVEAPLPGQPHSISARRYLEEKYLGEEVLVDLQGRSREGATSLARLTTARDQSDLGVELVEAGYAWALPGTDRHYVQAEESARRRKLGLWRDGSPLAPWQFRAAQLKQARARQALEHRMRAKQESVKKFLAGYRGMHSSAGHGWTGSVSAGSGGGYRVGGCGRR